jgi:hypothetical protein
MSKNFIGSVILVAIIVVGFLFMPIYYMAQIDMSRAQEELLNETQLFIDKVADTKKITQRDLEDFTLAMAGTTVPVKFEIIREVHQVNPDPASTTTPRATYSSWVPVDDISKFNDGDILIVRVDQIGKSLYQSFTVRALGMYTPEVDFTLSRMVR